MFCVNCGAKDATYKCGKTAGEAMKKQNNTIIIIAMFFMALTFGAGFLIGKGNTQPEFSFTLFKTTGDTLTEIPMSELTKMPLTFCAVPASGSSDPLPDGSKINFAGGLALEVSNGHGGAWRFCTGIPSGTTPPTPKNGI